MPFACLLAALAEVPDRHRRLAGLRSRWRAIRTACPWSRRGGDAGDLGPGLDGLGPGGPMLGSGIWRRRRWKRLLIPSGAERKRCAWPADLKRVTCRSRRRVGWRAFSALLFSPLCVRCSTEGIAARSAAPQLASSSVTMTRGGRTCFFSSLRSRRSAACLSRRLCARMSSAPVRRSREAVWSTARHGRYFTPASVGTTSSRHRLSPAAGSLRRVWRATALAELQRPLAHGLVSDNEAARCQQAVPPRAG